MDKLNEIKRRTSVFVKFEIEPDKTMSELCLLDDELLVLLEEIRLLEWNTNSLEDEIKAVQELVAGIKEKGPQIYKDLKNGIESRTTTLNDMRELSDRDFTLEYMTKCKDIIDSGENIGILDQKRMINMLIHALSVRTTKERNPLADALMAKNKGNIMRDRKYGTIVARFYLLNGNQVNKAIGEAIKHIAITYKHQISPSRLKEIWSRDKAGHISRAQNKINKK